MARSSGRWRSHSPTAIRPRPRRKPAATRMRGVSRPKSMEYLTRNSPPSARATAPTHTNQREVMRSSSPMRWGAVGRGASALGRTGSGSGAAERSVSGRTTSGSGVGTSASSPAEGTASSASGSSVTVGSATASSRAVPARSIRVFCALTAASNCSLSRPSFSVTLSSRSFSSRKRRRWRSTMKKATRPRSGMASSASTSSR